VAYVNRLRQSTVRTQTSNFFYVTAEGEVNESGARPTHQPWSGYCQNASSVIRENHNCRRTAETTPPPAGNGSLRKDDGGGEKNHRCRTYTPPGRRGTGPRQKDDGGSRDVGAEKIIAAGPIPPAPAVRIVPTPKRMMGSGSKVVIARLRSRFRRRKSSRRRPQVLVRCDLRSIRKNYVASVISPANVCCLPDLRDHGDIFRRCECANHCEVQNASHGRYQERERIAQRQIKEHATHIATRRHSGPRDHHHDTYHSAEAVRRHGLTHTKGDAGHVAGETEAEYGRQRHK
jgi:hypothetical protein